MMGSEFDDVTSKVDTPRDVEATRAKSDDEEEEAAKAEEARLHRLKQRDATAALHHEKVNRAMLR
jgi:hypothetical protein